MSSLSEQRRKLIVNYTFERCDGKIYLAHSVLGYMMGNSTTWDIITSKNCDEFKLKNNIEMSISVVKQSLRSAKIIDLFDLKEY